MAEKCNYQANAQELKRMFLKHATHEDFSISRE